MTSSIAVESDTRAVPITASIVGVQKAATSTLHRMLVRHRRVAKGPVKEWHYFDDYTRDWKAPDWQDYRIRTERASARFGLDSTPIYLFWPHALERMRAYNPEMKLIATFRDPIERAFSQWSMQRGREPSYPDFREFLTEPTFVAMPDAITDEASDERLRTRTLIARGLYGRQLRRGLELFPRDQWLLLEFGSFLDAPERTLDRATDFLGLHRFRSYPSLVHRNKSPRSHTGAPPTGADIAGFAELYADDLAEFVRLSGVDVSGWPTTQILAGDLDPADLAKKLAHKAGLLA